jgi:hypothetical protein
MVNKPLLFGEPVDSKGIRVSHETHLSILQSINLDDAETLINPNGKLNFQDSRVSNLLKDGQCLRVSITSASAHNLDELCAA